MDILTLGLRRAEELGVIAESNPWLGVCYKAKDIHKLLGEAEECWLREHKSNSHIPWDVTTDRGFSSGVACHSHQALLIGIKPIVAESQERKLLREILKYVAHNSFTHEHLLHPVPDNIVTRAKALLEKP